MNKKWQICVCGAIMNDDEFLLIKRNDNEEEYSGFWEMPSGKLEFGEKVQEGLQREIFEEIGIDISKMPTQLINVSEYDSQNQDTIKYTVQLNFLVKVPTKELPIKLSSEHTDYVWVKRDSNYIDDFISEIIEGVGKIR